MSLRTSDFDYSLPPRLIAQTPAEPRDQARLLVLDRATGELEYRRFYDLPSYLHSGDLLVLNDTRVFPARLIGTKEGGGTRVEVLLLRQEAEGIWEALVRPSRRMPPGSTVSLEGGNGRKGRVTVLERTPNGSRRVQLRDGVSVEEMGRVPLPPYIRTPLEDADRYQTVYARERGSVAAPTAGLHFTPELLEALRSKGVRLAMMTLHVGPGTFRPVRSEDPLKHEMDQEAFTLPAETVQAIQETRKRGGRVICVGTTSVRVLETVAKECGVGDGDTERLRPMAGSTGLYILPGFRFRLTDALITNFHLPRSTLLMLVAAFAGKAAIDRAYAEAIHRKYRFYSFGDAMLIL